MSDRQNYPEPQSIERSGHSVWERINNLVVVRFLLFFAAGWAFIQILNYFQTVIIVFSTAAIVAFLLNYPVRRLERYLPHGLAVFLVFFFSVLSIGGFLLALGLAIVSQGPQLIDNMTEFINALNPLFQRLENFFEAKDIQVNVTELEQAFRERALALVVSSVGFLEILFTNLILFILISVVSLFMLLDGRRLWQLFMKIVPLHLRSRLNRMIQRNFLGFFRGQILLMLFLMTSSLIVFLVLRVNFPLILAVIVGLLDLIPGIGATLGVAVVCFIVLSQSVWLALKVLIACIVLQQIQDNFVGPRVMQDAVNINPVIVFFAFLVGVRVAGILGVFLAIPLTGVAVSWFEIEEMKGEIE